jgi:hypothetical protein
MGRDRWKLGEHANAEVDIIGSASNERVLPLLITRSNGDFRCGIHLLVITIISIPLILVSDSDVIIIARHIKRSAIS